LADDISEDEANLIFKSVAQKMIKDGFKHTRCISVASYYTLVNLLPVFNNCFVVIVF
jgi:hypothetical protein